MGKHAVIISTGILKEKLTVRKRSQMREQKNKIEEKMFTIFQ